MGRFSHVTQGAEEPLVAAIRQYLRSSETPVDFGPLVKAIKGIESPEVDTQAIAQAIAGLAQTIKSGQLDPSRDLKGISNAIASIPATDLSGLRLEVAKNTAAVDALTAQTGRVADAMAAVAKAVARPKQVKRDENGNIVGVA